MTPDSCLHAGETSYRCAARPPVRDVVDDTEVHHAIVGGVLRLDGGGVSNPQADAVAPGGQPSAGQGDHLRFQVEGVDLAGAKMVKDKLHAATAATAHLQGQAAVDVAAQAPKVRQLVVALEGSAQGVIHQQELGA